MKPTKNDIRDSLFAEAANNIKRDIDSELIGRMFRAAGGTIPEIQIIDDILDIPSHWVIIHIKVLGYRHPDGRIELLLQKYPNKSYTVGDRLTPDEFSEAFLGEML